MLANRSAVAFRIFRVAIPAAMLSRCKANGVKREVLTDWSAAKRSVVVWEQMISFEAVAGVEAGAFSVGAVHYGRITIRITMGSVGWNESWVAGADVQTVTESIDTRFITHRLTSRSVDPLISRNALADVPYGTLSVDTGWITQRQTAPDAIIGILYELVPFRTIANVNGGTVADGAVDL